MTIQEKARVALQAKADNDPRYRFLLAMLTAVTGLSAAECEKRIEDLANVSN